MVMASCGHDIFDQDNVCCELRSIPTGSVYKLIRVALT